MDTQEWRLDVDVKQSPFLKLTEYCGIINKEGGKDYGKV